LFFFIFLIAAIFPNYSNSQTQTVKPEPTQKKIDPLSKGTDSSNRREYTEDELMQKFFNKKVIAKSNQPSTLFLPIYYEGMSKPLIDVQARGKTTLAGLENVEIDLNTVFQILEIMVDPLWLAKIEPLKKKCEEQNLKSQTVEKKTVKSICWGSLDLLADTEVRFIYDQKLLMIKLLIIPQLRSKRITSLVLQSSSNTEAVTNSQSWFSSFINFNLSQSIDSNELVYKDGRLPLNAKLSSGTRFGEFLVEADARATEKRTEAADDSPSFVRENVRGVVDFESMGLRSQWGDLSYPTRTFQKAKSMAGVAIFTQPTMGTTLAQFTNSYEINLTRPSKIAIYINEIIIQTLELPAGRHDLRDFPFLQGENNLKLEITDDLGRTEVQNYSVLLNNELLKPHEQFVSYALGAPMDEVNGIRSYNSNNLTFSLMHRYGLSDGLTLGGGYQTDSIQKNAQAEFLFATKFGYVSFEPGFSQYTDRPNGYAARMRFVMQDVSAAKKMNGTKTFEISTESENYSFFNSTTTVNPVNLRFTGLYAKPLSKESNLNLTLNYDFNRKLAADDVSNSYSFSVGTTRQWLPDLSTNFNFRHTTTPLGKSEVSILLFLVWSQPKEKQFVTASGESVSSTSRADWTYQPDSGVGGSKTRLNLQNKKLSTSYGGNVDYTANRALLYASHQIDVLKEDPTQTQATAPSKTSHRTNLQLSSAISFAGGHFAISQPISDSFALFVPLKNLDNNTVLVNLQKNGTYISQTDWLGAAVASDISSYNTSNFILKEKIQSEGIALPKDNFTLRPKYKSGYSIEVGTDATIYFKTKLIGPDKMPLSLASARVYLMNGKDRDNTIDPVSVFTNRSGLVRSEGFRHGTYQIEILDDDKYEVLEFTIPESAENNFELPELILKERQSK
jgi:outer membrane usher protein